jgi:hypothetical protein
VNPEKSLFSRRYVCLNSTLVHLYVRQSRRQVVPGITLPHLNLQFLSPYTAKDSSTLHASYGSIQFVKGTDKKAVWRSFIKAN